ncbi:MAG: phosphoribosyl-AMP cyclohydrolase [Candidatus Omnitrophica bacterium]|nr:phosphoribosyl-AMP cyclohydrolase [Candidatus Omnitrophota bacterium]
MNENCGEGKKCNCGDSQEATDKIIANLKYDAVGLIPAIVQDEESGDVLMVAYMNEESLKITLKEKRTCFYSRSRQELWRKGDTSGHVQKLKSIYYDCDKDALLVKVDQVGGIACHTGERSCFFNKLV